MQEPPTSTDPLFAKMKAIEARAIERSRQRRAQESLPFPLEVSEVSAAPPSAAKAVMLPIWPDAVRAVPNGVLRSAMFGAIRRGARRYLHRERIAALDGIEIFYTGERLDQSDLDVWETVLHLVRLQSLGNECRVTAYQLLKALGKTDSGKNRDILDLRLSRLNATAVRVKQGRYSYEGSLIDGAYQDEETRAYVLIPALFFAKTRSSPRIAPSDIARKRRTNVSVFSGVTKMARSEIIYLNLKLT